MKIHNLHTLSEDFRVLYGKSLGYQIKYLWTVSWKRMPEIMSLGILSVGSIFPLFYCAYKRNGDRLPRYFREITILRPDDPRVPHIRHDDSLLLQRLV